MQEEGILGMALPDSYRIDKRGTLEMKLTRAKVAAQYAPTKAQREQAAKVVAATEAKIRETP